MSTFFIIMFLFIIGMTVMNINDKRRNDRATFLRARLTPARPLLSEARPHRPNASTRDSTVQEQTVVLASDSGA
jgi:uncharacterized membrane protein